MRIDVLGLNGIDDSMVKALSLLNNDIDLSHKQTEAKLNVLNMLNCLQVSCHVMSIMWR